MPRPTDPVIIDFATRRRLRQLQVGVTPADIPALIEEIHTARAEYCAARGDARRSAEAEDRIRRLLEALATAADEAWRDLGPFTELVALVHLVEFYCGPLNGSEPEDRAIAALLHAVLNFTGENHV